MSDDLIARLKLPHLERPEMDRLALQAQGGDRRAEESLFRRCFLLMATVCRDVYKHSPEWSDDIILETVSRSWTYALRSWDPGRGVPFSNWLALYVRRRVGYRAELLRAPKGTRSIEDDLGEGLRLADVLEADGASPEEVSLDRCALKRVLSLLDKRGRLVLVRRAQGVELRPLAARMGLSRERVRQLEELALAEAREIAVTGRRVIRVPGRPGRPRRPR